MNPAALRAATLDAAQLAARCANTDGIRAGNQRFNTSMWQLPGDAATAARELRAAEFPPDDEVQCARCHGQAPRTVHAPSWYDPPWAVRQEQIPRHAVITKCDSLLV